jgi:hypothetical protein
VSIAQAGIPNNYAVTVSRANRGSQSEKRRVAREEIIRAAEQEFLDAVARAIHGEETSTHRARAVQWAEILAGLRATRA